MFHDSIYLDSLTGLPNFFKLFESDLKELIGAKGCIVFIDIKNFKSVNDQYGRKIGDICLKNLATSIVNQRNTVIGAQAFRTQGDEFLLILPNISFEESENSVSKISTEFEQKNKEYCIDTNGLHIFICEYNQTIKSIADMFKLVIKQQSKNDSTNSDKKWIDDFVGMFINRIKETLSLLEDTYKLAITDDISGLYNSRAARLYLDNILENSKNEKHSIVFVDGDELKRYNDISYEAGNQMIKNLAQILSKATRKEDRVYRWLSGDEFLIVLKSTDKNAATELSDRIRQIVQDTTKDWELPLTISLGVSTFPDDAIKVDKLINFAEKANALAKKRGKNQVVVWEK